MALISLLSRLVNGVQRQVDLSTNTLVLGAMQLKGATSGTFTQNVPSTVTTYSVVWPSAVAAANGYVLSSDTSGNLTWVPATASNVLDSTFRIENSSDITKQIAFDASGIATGTTRTITMPNSNVNLGLVATAIQANGSVAFTANQPMGGFKLTGLGAGTTAGDSVRYEQAILISGVNAFAASQSMGNFNLTNLADGVNPQDAINLRQLQAQTNGLSWKTVVRSATTTTLPANTYNNGASGVGATLTGNANGALSAQDGVTLVVNDRLLVKNEAAPANNGIYTLTTVGTGGTPYVLTRATDSDTQAKLVFEAVQVGSEATTQAGYSYREATAAPITIGTTSIVYVNWATGTSYNFRNGLTTSGANVDVVAGDTSLTSTPGSLIVNLNAASGLVTSSGLQINLATTNPGLAITTNKLDVKYNPAGAIVASSTGIAWNPDNSSLEINTNAARIKTTAYDQVTITGGGGSAAAVAQAPVVAWSDVAGQTFAANTTYAVRYGLTSNSETAGRVYACDTTTSSFDLFWCIGFIQTTGSVSAGTTVSVIGSGSLTLKSADTNFAGADTGKAIFLQAGGLNATTTAPSTAGLAVAVLGIVQSTTSFRINIKAPFVA